LSETFVDQLDVRILDTREKKLDKVDFLPCDIRDHDQVDRALSDVDIVVHAAIIQIPQINENKRLGYEVNILGTQNICDGVRKSPRCKGLILVSSWHTIGERGITGLIDESFGLRPDMVEERARAYALSKMGQEAIVRLHDENSKDKIYGVIRIGTALGENMPTMTAANLFINKALKGEPLTPYEHSMFRPMLYIDIRDVCRAFKAYVDKILENRVTQAGNSLDHIANVYYPEPMTILELAEIVKESVEDCSNGKIRPKISAVKTGEPVLFTPQSKDMIKVNLGKSKEFLGLETFTNPRETIKRIVHSRLANR